MDIRRFGLTLQHSSDSLKHAAIITAAGFAVVTALGYLIGFRQPLLNAESFLFYAMISVPLQELVFRGFLLTKMERFGTLFAILASSAVYAAAHFTNPLLVALTFPAGMAWGYSFAKTRTLTGSVVSHAILGLYLFSFVL